MQAVVVERGHTVELPVSLWFNVAEDILVSHIRETEDVTSDVIAEWEIEFVTDGTDGELLFRLSYLVTETIVADEGYMFFRSFKDEEPVDIFNSPLLVVFVDV